MKRKVLKGKLLVWLLALMMIVASMTGCGQKEDDEDKDSKSRKEQSVDDEDEGDDGDAEITDKDTEAEDSEEEVESEEKDVAEEVFEEEKEVEEEEETKEVIETEASNDAYDVVVKMVDACQGKMMTKSTMNMELEMSMGVEGFFIDMDMVMSGDTYASEDPFMTYSELTLDMNAMGQDMTEIVKSYTVEEDGKIVTYAYSGSENQWFKEDVDVDVDVATMQEQQKVTYQFLLNKPAEEFVLDSELHNIDGKDAYKLSFTLTGAELQEAMKGMASMEDVMAEAGMEDLDMSALKVPAVYYIDAENYQIIGMEMSIEGMDEMIDELMTELMATEGEEYSMTFELGKCNMIYSNISYEPVEIPALPEEVLTMQGESVDVEFDA